MYMKEKIEAFVSNYGSPVVEEKIDDFIEEMCSTIVGDSDWVVVDESFDYEYGSISATHKAWGLEFNGPYEQDVFMVFAVDPRTNDLFNEWFGKLVFDVYDDYSNDGGLDTEVQYELDTTQLTVETVEYEGVELWAVHGTVGIEGV